MVFMRIIQTQPIHDRETNTLEKCYFLTTDGAVVMTGCWFGVGIPFKAVAPNCATKHASKQVGVIAYPIYISASVAFLRIRRINIEIKKISTALFIEKN